MAADVEQVRRQVIDMTRSLAERGVEIEQAGRLPSDVVAALHEAGVFRLWMPAELGGFEAAPAAVVDIVQSLAAADGSTGWCAATGIASNIAGALLAEPVARELYRNPATLCGGALMPGGTARPQPDGSYLVDGRWSFGSGTEHCDWVIGGALVQQGGPPSMRAVLMPRSAVTFHSNWQVIGLEGTASVDYEVSGLSLPAEHAIDLATSTPWPAGAMWRIPLRSLLYPVLAAVPLGIAGRAVAELVALSGRVRYGSQARLADRETVQAAVGRAQALVTAGSAHLSGALQALRLAADSGRAPSVTERAAARVAATYATEQATEAVTLCYQTAGGVAIHRDNPLQRALRDVLTCGQHYALSQQGYAIVGRVILGLEPDLML
jgi:alkylation response protein AidB-like acyl-CoA dehydrogenase